MDDILIATKYNENTKISSNKNLKWRAKLKLIIFLDIEFADEVNIIYMKKSTLFKDYWKDWECKIANINMPPLWQQY